MTRAGQIVRQLVVAMVVFVPDTGLSNPGPIAEVLCEPEARMQQKLAQHFGAKRIWQGLRSPDQIMELWQDHNGDWTLVVVHAGGNHCIVAMGSALGGLVEQFQG